MYPGSQGSIMDRKRRAYSPKCINLTVIVTFVFPAAVDEDPKPKHLNSRIRILEFEFESEK